MMAVDLTGKTILITSGGTLEKWDKVRGHTNMATGTMGTYLAEEAQKLGATIIYLNGYFAKKPTNDDNLLLITFEGIEDLGEKIKHFVTTQSIDAVIMAAAGSDWLVDEILDQQGQPVLEAGKLSSDEPPIIKFKKAPKILPQIKTWNADVTLVGFKLEDATNEELVARAKKRMNTSKASFMVANQSGSLYTTDVDHYIINEQGDYEIFAGKRAAAKGLMATLATHLNH